MEKIYLSLGSNIGDRKANLSFAALRLTELPLLQSLKKSSIYLTEPWGNTEQDAFYNAVIEAETEYLPWELLSQCQAIEQEAGRERLLHWGPRPLDIDILWYGGQHIATSDLQVPHPYLAERLFVMMPLTELAPELDIPLKGRLDLLLAGYSGAEKIEKVYSPDEW